MPRLSSTTARIYLGMPFKGPKSCEGRFACHRAKDLASSCPSFPDRLLQKILYLLHILLEWPGKFQGEELRRLQRSEIFGLGRRNIYPIKENRLTLVPRAHQREDPTPVSAPPKSDSSFDDALVAFRKKQEACLKEVDSLLELPLHSLRSGDWESVDCAWNALRLATELSRLKEAALRFEENIDETSDETQYTLRKMTLAEISASLSIRQEKLSVWWNKNSASFLESIDAVGDDLFGASGDLTNIAQLNHRVSCKQLEKYRFLLQRYRARVPSPAKDVMAKCQKRLYQLHLYFFQKGEVIVEGFPDFLLPPQGLANVGNSCWLNALLQNLMVRKEFYSVLSREDPWRDETWPGRPCLKGESVIRPLICDLADHTKKEYPPSDMSIDERFEPFAASASSRSRISATSKNKKSIEDILFTLKSALMQEKRIPDFEQNSWLLQQDVAAAIPYFMDAMKISFILSEKREFTEPTSQNRATTLPHFEIFNNLPLQLPEGVTDLQDLLDVFFDAESIREGERCDKISCTYLPAGATEEKSVLVSEAVKHTALLSPLPSLLPIHLKRFRYEKEGQKITTPITFPLAGEKGGGTINLRKYVEDSDEIKLHYVVTGFICHFGEYKQGHYVACVYRPDKQQWFLCDDRRIEPLSVEQVKAWSDSAYFLFLHQIGS